MTGVEPKQRTRSPYQTPTVTLSDGTKFTNPCWFLNGEPVNAHVVVEWMQKIYGDDPIPLSDCKVENFSVARDGVDVDKMHDTR